jgi:hypothetical protein
VPAWARWILTPLSAAASYFVVRLVMGLMRDVRVGLQLDTFWFIATGAVSAFALVFVGALVAPAARTRVAAALTALHAAAIGNAIIANLVHSVDESWADRAELLAARLAAVVGTLVAAVLIWRRERAARAPHEVGGSEELEPGPPSVAGLEAAPAPRPPMPPARRLGRADFAILLGLVLVLVAVRVALLLSILPELHQEEFTRLGRLALDLEDGTAVLWGPAAFRQAYQYGFHAEGTMATAIVTALLSLPLGANGWALYGSTIFFEVVLALFAGVLLLKTTDWWLALIALLPLLHPPMLVATQQLSPSGNHTEFLWIPMAIALFLAVRDTQERPWWHWLAPAALLAAGVVLYRLNIACATGLLLAVLARGTRRTALLGVAALLLGVLAARQIGGQAGGFGYMLDGLSFERLAPGPLADWAWTYVPVTETRWGRPFRVCLAVLLGVGLVSLIRPGRFRVPAGFALGWAGGVLGALILLDQPVYRYHVALLYAVLLCGWIGLASLPGWWRAAPAVALALLGLFGVSEQMTHQRPGAWSEHAAIDSLALGQRLGVYRIKVDQLPYYQRMLDEGRWNMAVGVMPYPLEQDEEQVHEFPAGTVADAVSHLRQIFEREGPPVDLQFEHAGRGAWISGGRDLERVRAFWIAGGVTEPELSWLWAGAVAEAALWGVFPEEPAPSPEEASSPEEPPPSAVPPAP